jgi:tetratricopeptide (TPR) repeat protein
MPIPQEWLQYAPKPRPLNDGNEWNVFLSYRSINRPWVLCLYDVLVEVGHKVFLDQYVLKGGDKLIGRLQDALGKSQSGVLIWSAGTGNSVWVNDEYEVLQQKANTDPEFIFVPVRVDGSNLPLFAANRIYFDFSAYPDGPNGGELLRLLSAIAGMPLQGEAVHFANEQDEISKELAAKVNAAIKNNNPARLIQLFSDGGLPWQTSASLGCRAAEGLIKLKKYDDAINMLKKIETQFRKALRPQQLKALALAKRGNPGDLEMAQEILGALYEENHLDPETMGIYGRTWMDRYATTNDINDLEQSRDLYAEAFEKAPDDYYTGINAASKSVFIGTNEDLGKAAEIAAKVEKLVGTKEIPGDYWKTATVAEVFLIQKKYKEAGDMYEKAVAMARSERGSHESTYKQAKRLMEKLQTDEENRKVVLAAFKEVDVR